jgi:hypothetical protein
MNNIDVQVNPSPYVKPTVNIGNLRISVMNIVLFNSVSVQAVLFDADNNYIDTKIIVIKDADYLNWGNDDSYIVNYVLNELNLTQST